MAVRQNTYEKQAKLSVLLAIVGGVCTLAGAFFILRAFDPTSFQTVYSSRSLRLPAILGALFVGLGAAGIGWLLGLLSAGNRLNKLNRLSWIGFFACSGVIALGMSLGIFFYLTRFAPPVSKIPGAG
ncbi:MAG: hypothetical protein PVJ57_14230 [Phycisphaerae bacterium]